MNDTTLSRAIAAPADADRPLSFTAAFCGFVSTTALSTILLVLLNHG